MIILKIKEKKNGDIAVTKMTVKGCKKATKEEKRFVKHVLADQIGDYQNLGD